MTDFATIVGFTVFLLGGVALLTFLSVVIQEYATEKYKGVKNFRYMQAAVLEYQKTHPAPWEDSHDTE